MKNKVNLMLIMLLITLFANAQDMVMVSSSASNAGDPKSVKTQVYEFMAFSQEQEIKNTADVLIDKHFLGNDVAVKMFLLNKSYGFEQSVAPGSGATKTIYIKPVIYNSVKRIERELKKKIKAGVIDETVAAEEFTKVLDIALNIVNQNTAGFENRLASLNDSNDLLGVYLNEVKLNRVN